MSNVNGDGPIDLHPPLRDAEQIVFCHDILRDVINGTLDLFPFDNLNPDVKERMRGASEVLCWVLQDGNPTFAEHMRGLKESLSDLGYTWKSQGN